MKKVLIIVLIIVILFQESNLILSSNVYGFSLTKTNNLNLAWNNKSTHYKKVSDLEPGDILFRISQYVVIHCLIFKQYNATTQLYEFIEANSEHGVRRIFYSESILNNTLIYKKFARVKTANLTQKKNAILFAESQIGKEFEWDMFFHNKNNVPDDSNDPFSDSWYCTELVWAAYYNCNHTSDEKIYGEGIDIDRNGWGKDSLIFSMVWPLDILLDDDVDVYYLNRNRDFDLGGVFSFLAREPNFLSKLK